MHSNTPTVNMEINNKQTDFVFYVSSTCHAFLIVLLAYIGFLYLIRRLPFSEIKRKLLSHLQLASRCPTAVRGIRQRLIIELDGAHTSAATHSSPDFDQIKSSKLPADPLNLNESMPTIGNPLSSMS